MEALIAIACGIVGVFALGMVLLLPLRIKFTRELRRKTRYELEQMVYRYEPEYFSYIGNHNAEVIVFKTLIEQRDLQGIRKSWRNLSRSFLKLERKAGHRGRPLIMEYYCWYELSIRELNSRRI